MRRIILLCGLIGLAAAASSEDLKAKTLEVKQKLKTVLSAEDNPLFDYGNATATADRFCSGFMNNIEAEVDKSIDCIANITLEGKTMCRTLQTDVPDCFENVIIFFEECLEAPGNQMPRFLLHVAKSVTKYLCEATGEQQLELFNPCLYKETEFSKRLEEGTDGAKEKFDVENPKLPSKNELCKDILEDKHLLTSHITTACSGKVTQDAAIGFVDALFAPCQGSDDSTNTL